MANRKSFGKACLPVFYAYFIWKAKTIPAQKWKRAHLSSVFFCLLLFFFFLLEYECPKHPCYLFTTFMRRCEFSARPLSPKQSRLNCIYYGDELSPKNHEIRFSSMPKCLATWADCLPCDNMLPVGWYSSTYAGAPHLLRISGCECEAFKWRVSIVELLINCIDLSNALVSM